MLVTFISQCEKKALNRTRRILDAFANRIGDNVWQTAITEDGLDTVKKLLRQSATKSTAVSCHRVRTRQRSELVWVVGNRKKFGEQGLVAVNRTKRNILHSEWENNWQNLNAIAIISTLSALLHDIGKSTNGFQHKLFHPTKLGDPYRHEWISLKLLIWLIKDCQSDDDVWQRLQNLDIFLAENQPNTQDLQNNIEKSEFDKLSPVAQWIAWLVITHHRIPSLEGYFFDASQRQNYLKTNNRYFKRDLNSYYQKYIKPLDYWVKNPKSISEMKDKEKEQFFSFDNLVLNSPTWQKQLKRYAKKAEQDVVLQQLSQQNKAIANPFLLLLSRMSVMVADHNYSSLKTEDKAKRVKGSKDWETKLTANTDRKSKEPNQALDEHLLGVARFTTQFCRSLPILHEKLPKLINHEPLVRNTANTLFAWQNKAFKLALSQSEHSELHGFFGINMASTGCGKTIGNARIMYALANPKKGARLTIALGLRVLTLQTGQSFRQNLKLTDSELAILVGGQAQKQLFDINQHNNDDNYFEQFGSESAESLIDELVDSDDVDATLDELNLGTVVEDNSARKLIGSPIVTCTIDHLMQASECKRGGKYIAPMLRLFSGDLILDEPDDFDQHDMPALSRLVHLAGLFGSRVLLSSATLPPDMLEGLFQAYLAGRKIYNEQFGYASPKVCCAWFDENNATSTYCQNHEQFHVAHGTFIQKRCRFLQKQPTRRMAKILPLSMVYHGEKQAQFYQDIATQLLQYASHFHKHHHITACEKKVSIGLIRMANIQPLMQIAQAMHQLASLDGVQDTQFYLCCYHSQQVLALRNRLENRLDKVLTRKNVTAEDFMKRSDIQQAIAKHPNKTNHIFIVLATPVAEVGRDHDYDWALVEPSSMRSIIQLAGRVWRHRTDKVADTPNIGIWQHNIRALKSRLQTHSNHAVFAQPGFENQQYQLDSHDMNELVDTPTLHKIDAVSRIQKSAEPNPKGSLVDLEHQVMADLMNNSGFNVVNAYFKDEQTANRHHVHLSVLTPFRAGRANVEYIIKPDEDTFNIYSSESVKEHGLNYADTVNSVIQPYEIMTVSPLVDVWLDSRLETVLADLGQKFPEFSPNSIVIRFSNVALADHQNGYYFDERFGCWKKH